MNFDQALEAQVKQLADVLRSQLSVEETIGGFTFDLKIRGRLNGDLEVTYKLNDQYESYANEVTGNSLSAVIEEYLRRHGWKREHQPLCLPAA